MNTILKDIEDIKRNKYIPDKTHFDFANANKNNRKELDKFSDWLDDGFDSEYGKDTHDGYINLENDKLLKHVKNYRFEELNYILKKMVGIDNFYDKQCLEIKVKAPLFVCYNKNKEKIGLCILNAYYDNHHTASEYPVCLISINPAGQKTFSYYSKKRLTFYTGFERFRNERKMGDINRLIVKKHSLNEEINYFDY